MGKIIKGLPWALAEKERIASQILFFLFVYILLYFFFLGVTTTPEIINESDSLAYHIPIAKNISQGDFLYPPKLINDIGFYPAVGESILALLMFLGVPLNLFNWLGLILLFLVCLKLGKTFGLNDQASIIFASSIVLLNSVLRLILTQTVDIWVAVFFVLSLILLQNPKHEISYFFKLGLSLGLLTGVKYSGIFLVFVLIVVYFEEITKRADLKKFIFFLTPFTILGLFWYIRNLIFKKSPFYPGGFLFFKGLTEYRIQEWNPLKTIFFVKNGFYLFIEALNSEYLIWPIFYILLPVIILVSKPQLDKSKLRLIFLSFLTFAIYLLTPSWPQNLVSDLRYLMPSIITLILTLFILAKDLNFYPFILLPVLTSVSVLPQLSYRPKITFVWLLFLIVILYFIKKRKLTNIKA